jgi:hypothetical protein
VALNIDPEPGHTAVGLALALAGAGGLTKHLHETNLAMRLTDKPPALMKLPPAYNEFMIGPGPSMS